jgi:hypothetical protein
VGKYHIIRMAADKAIFCIPQFLCDLMEDAKRHIKREHTVGIFHDIDLMYTLLHNCCLD